MYSIVCIRLFWRSPTEPKEALIESFYAFYKMQSGNWAKALAVVLTLLGGNQFFYDIRNSDLIAFLFAMVVQCITKGVTNRREGVATG